MSDMVKNKLELLYEAGYTHVNAHTIFLVRSMYTEGKILHVLSCAEKVIVIEELVDIWYRLYESIEACLTLGECSYAGKLSRLSKTGPLQLFLR